MATRDVWKRRALAVVPIALAVGLLAHAAIGAIYRRLGHAAAPLDDAYIHFQYARAIAEGHPFRFHAGAPPTSGATSVLWPVLLAPFYLVGFRGELVLWPAWAMSFVALGLLAYEAYALARPLAGGWCAAGAAAMVLGFGGFLWCAASGMEVVPFAWVIARAVRRASEWAEARDRDARSRRFAIELGVLSWAASLLRPEGAAVALFVAVTLAFRPARPDVRARVPALAPLAAVFALPLALFLVTGHAESDTAVAKLLVGNPYYPPRALFAAFTDNAATLVTTILDGEVWSAEFVPRGGAVVALAGLAALPVQGWRANRAWRASGIIVLALLMLAPCFYVTFVWNRLRYLWPFATGWLVGVACLAKLVGDLAALVRPRARMVGPLLAAGVAGLLAGKLEWVADDLAQSASGVDRQQVALGRWADATLDRAARIGVNDTGAIAYFSGRPTFDIVGLTTAGEARYWVAGVGSRLEHYERLHASSPGALPSCFIVYPEWLGLDFILGESMQEAIVTDATVLGGTDMRAYVADYSLLGSGEEPWTPPSGARLDALDVADLESEASHAYELLGAGDGEEVARDADAPEGRRIVDGGRTRRTRERFVVRLAPGQAAKGIVRLDGDRGTRVRVNASGELAAIFDLAGDGWEEHAFDIPASAAKTATPVDVEVEGGAVIVFHYWFDGTAP